jgi:hypothetical protein
MGIMHSPRSGGAAGSEVCGATDKSAAEWLEAALLGNILIEPWISGLRRFVIFGDSLADRRGPAGSGFLEATDRIVAERLEATILGNI